MSCQQFFQQLNATENAIQQIRCVFKGFAYAQKATFRPLGEEEGANVSRNANSMTRMFATETQIVSRNVPDIIVNVKVDMKVMEHNVMILTNVQPTQMFVHIAYSASTDLVVMNVSQPNHHHKGQHDYQQVVHQHILWLEVSPPFLVSPP